MIRLLVPSLGVLAGLWCAGCYYDSRWGESTRSQQRVAEARTPEELSPAGGGPSAGRASECSVELGMRVYDALSVGPGASHRAFEQVVARANDVITPDLACLTVREVRPWKQANATAPLTEQLAELRALDAGLMSTWSWG